MHGRDDEDDEREERERQVRKRAQMSPMDRLYGALPRKTTAGDDDLRSERRTGRLLPLLVRLHPRVRAIFRAVLKRDGPMSAVVLFELMLEAYLEKHGPIDQSLLPSDEELIRRIEEERDKRDGE